MSKTTQALAKLRDLPNDELQSALVTVRDELFRLKLGMQTNQVTSSAAVGAKRREIARILTILDGRRAGREPQGAAPAAKADAAAKPAAKAASKKSKKAAE